MWMGCQQQDARLFHLVSPEVSGVHFSNDIVDSDSFNILTYEYIYNGGGVALVDLNRDSLLDIFFTGNMVPNRLYLNRGDLRFEDITASSGAALAEYWCSGISVADLNADGWPDLYIATNTHQDASLRTNQLLLHQGLNDQGIPSFRSAAHEFGLADTSYSMNSIFFDYDRDNDLDLFVINNYMSEGTSPNRYRGKDQVEVRRIDKLYRNDSNHSDGRSTFTDISQEAGINVPGYSLGVAAVDFNEDGWTDLYVSNDFISNDALYINQGDGTFVDQASDYFKHTSHSAMGNDVADINNDGLLDVIALDMLPEDNYRKKTMMGPTNYMTYINNRRYGYDFQYVRNTLQLHQGFTPEGGQPLYADLAFMYGVAATDWSWAPLLADFDLDGYRDLLITNGFPRDITDRDFIDYQIDVQAYASAALLRDRIPEVKISNYAFRNRAGQSFQDVTDSWGMDIASFSNGAAYGDLDNDGDLDVVVNNINDIAFVYQNTLNPNLQSDANLLRIKLVGPSGNPAGLGTKVTCRQGGTLQRDELRTSRGYLSVHEAALTFAFPRSEEVEVELQWPDGKSSIHQLAPTASKTHYLHYEEAMVRQRTAGDKAEAIISQTVVPGLDVVHEEFDYVDFNVQPLLPHKLSQYGPGLTVGDVNGDGRYDLYMGGSTDRSGQLFVQQEDGSFKQDDLASSPAEAYHEETGVLFFDADNDGDQDLYVASGGYEFGAQDSFYTATNFISTRQEH